MTSREIARRPILHDDADPETLLKRDPRIRKAVNLHGYSQREVADHLGMHHTTISRIVNEGGC